MGSGGHTNTQSWTNTLSGPTADVIARGNNVLDKATPLFENYTPYEGARVADFDSLFGQAKDLIQGQIKAGPQDINSQRGILDSIRSSLDPSKTTQQYMDPYLEGVLAPTIRRLNEQGQLAQNSINSGAAMAGAYGDAGYGVATAQRARDQNQAVGDATARGYSGAWADAARQKSADLATLLQTGSQYGTLQDKDLSRTMALSGALDQFSNQGRAIDQAKLDASYDKFQTDQNTPLQRLQALLGMITSGPHQTLTNSNTVSQQPTTGLQSLLGTLTGSLFNGGSQGFMGSAIGQGMSALGPSIGSALSVFSDERMKENVKKVGSTDDGQPIYSFNYKGGGPTVLGLLAQETEKTKPEAVSVDPASGMKKVDYGVATEDAAGAPRTPKDAGILEALMRGAPPVAPIMTDAAEDIRGMNRPAMTIADTDAAQDLRGMNGPPPAQSLIDQLVAAGAR